MKEAFERSSKNYDLILIDCPPSLNLITLNALVAADGLLVPLQVEFYALEGMTSLLQTVDAVRARFNPRSKIEGVVLTMYDKRNSLSVAVERDVRAYFGDRFSKPSFRAMCACRKRRRTASRFCFTI